MKIITIIFLQKMNVSMFIKSIQMFAFFVPKKKVSKCMCLTKIILVFINKIFKIKIFYNFNYDNEIRLFILIYTI
jgi:hypothetical protein